MKILVGLGNPGQKYERNRHNIGFMAIEKIAQECGMTKWRARHQGLASEGRLGASQVVLLKPQTQMNRSGQSVGEAMRYLRLTPADIIVFHDELDLAPGKVRSKTGGGHAGHNGLRSIHQHIGPDFVRVRLGIGHPGDRQLVTGHVLGNFRRSDDDWLSELLAAVAACAPALVEDGTEGFQNCLGRRRQAGAPAADAGPADYRDGQTPIARPAGPFSRLAALFRGQGKDRN